MTPFPFSAIVGHDDLKLALLLATVDRAIGGVLLRGEKGSAKTTAARGLAALLPDGAPFVELPLGATEDRVVGTIDLARVVAGEGVHVRRGLLADADGGVLYVDEVNLLADHLVDVLLDVAVSGVNVIEREGVSHRHDSRFVLIGSMNPEEGELRPQLLDRFGLAVDVHSALDAETRAEIVRRRLDFDRDTQAFGDRWHDAQAEIAERLRDARPAAVPDALLGPIARLCAGVGAEGLRADLVVARAAAALAGWEGRDEATTDDVRRVAPLALAHRRRRDPFDPPTFAPEELAEQLDEALGDTDVPREHDAAPPVAPVALAAPRVVAAPEGRRSPTVAARGRLVRDRPFEGGPVAVHATVRATVEAGEPVLLEAVREAKAANLVVIAVDTSGSMGVELRMNAVTAAIGGLLVDSYQRRDRVAVVTFRDAGAEVTVRPTGSVEVARARLATVVTGGRTPLAAGITRAMEVALTTPGNHQPLVVIVTDGRATAAEDGDPVDAAMHAAAEVRRRGVAAVVVDAEDGATRLGLARRLAEAMGARYLRVEELASTRLVAP